MRFASRDDEELAINLTPLIDVVFLLLIFFMVSTTFSKQSRLQIQLPQASVTQRPDLDRKPLEIDIDRRNRIMVSGAALAQPTLPGDPDIAELQRLLQSAAVGIDNPLVIIRADRESYHETMIKVLDAARRAGLVRITFATELRPG